MTVIHNVEYNRLKDTVDQNITCILLLQQNHKAISIHSLSLNHLTAAHNHTRWSRKARDERSRTGKKHKGKLVFRLLFHLK